MVVLLVLVVAVSPHPCLSPQTCAITSAKWSRMRRVRSGVRLRAGLTWIDRTSRSQTIVKPPRWRSMQRARAPSLRSSRDSGTGEVLSQPPAGRARVRGQPDDDGIAVRARGSDAVARRRLAVVAVVGEQLGEPAL